MLLMFQSPKYVNSGKYWSSYIQSHHFSNFDKISKTKRMHQRAIDLFQAWYNFIKPHKSLRLKIDSENRKWFQRTPAMAEGITDHIWSLKELLTFRVPVQ